MPIRHVLTILAVEDLPRMTRFYEEVLGVRRAVDAPVYAELALPGGMRVGLYERTAFGRNTGRVPHAGAPGELRPCELYFQVDGDLAAAIATAEAAGAHVLSPASRRDWGDVAVYFADPEGNVLVLAQSYSAAS